MPAVKKNILALVRSPPEPIDRAESLLNQILAMAAFEHSVTVVFQNAGILQLYPYPSGIFSSVLAPHWTMLPDYDVTELYITEKTVQDYAHLGALCLPLKPIQTTKIIALIQKSDWVLSA